MFDLSYVHNSVQLINYRNQINIYPKLKCLFRINNIYYDITKQELNILRYLATEFGLPDVQNLELTIANKCHRGPKLF
jgi:hypothetical protein